MAKTSTPDVPTTPDELYKTYVQDGWGARLDACSKDRIDDDVEFAEGEKEYRRRRLSRHYENGVLIAFTIEHLYHDLHTSLKVKMLLIDGARHICP